MCGGYAGKVVLFDRDGNQRWESTGDEFNWAFGIAATDNGLLVVCDLYNNRLQVLSAATGAYVRSIGGEGQFNGPRCVAYDPVARVLVVGERYKVSVCGRSTAPRSTPGAAWAINLVSLRAALESASHWMALFLWPMAIIIVFKCSEDDEFVNTCCRSISVDFSLFVLLNYDKNDIFCCLVGVPFLHLLSVCPVCLSMQINFRGIQYY